MPEFPFSLDNSSNPHEIRSALRHLRHMVRLGKLAEKALADLKTNGSTGRVCIAVPSYDADKIYYARVVSFPPASEVTRDKMPHYNELDISFENIRYVDTPNTSSGRTMYFEIHMKGQYLAYDCRNGVISSEDHGSGEWFSDGRVHKNQVKIGWNDAAVGRMLKNSHGDPVQNTLLKIPSKQGTPEYERARMLFARAYSRTAVRCHFTHSREWDLKEVLSIPQWMVDLQRNMETWLIEDGKVDEWLDRVKAMAFIGPVMAR